VIIGDKKDNIMKYIVKTIVIITLLQAISLNLFAQYGNVGGRITEKLGNAIGDAWEDGLRNPIYLGNEYKYWAVGLGYGVSYGGLGVKLLRRLGEQHVIPGISAGIGYNFDGRNKIENVSGSIFWTVGFQMYIENFYVDMQFGQMERVKYKETEKNQLGLGMLMGYNWFFYEKWGINAALGLASPISMSKDDELYINNKIFADENIHFVWEIGLLYKF
jgi:hypothetical protein